MPGLKKMNLLTTVVAYEVRSNGCFSFSFFLLPFLSEEFFPASKTTIDYLSYLKTPTNGYRNSDYRILDRIPSYQKKYGFDASSRKIEPISHLHSPVIHSLIIRSEILQPLFSLCLSRNRLSPELAYPRRYSTISILIYPPPRKITTDK